MGVFRTQKGDREVVVMVVEQGGGMLFGFINVEQCMDERFGSTRVVTGCILAENAPGGHHGFKPGPAEFLVAADIHPFTERCCIHQAQGPDFCLTGAL